MALALRESSSVPPLSERELVQAVRDGEDWAFETLFSRYRRRVSAYVYALLGDHGRAEDVTQEVFISALRRLRETERDISFKPWLYEIARNACIDEFRRTRRASLVSLEHVPDAQGHPVPLLADNASPEARWERKQQLDDLFGAFSGLSDSHHRILVLRELEGLSYGEIGQRMGMSRPVVESTLFRARHRLSQEYDELSSGRRCQDVRAAVDEQEQRALTSLGIRQRRQIVRHLDHCHACLRYVRSAGIDHTALRTPGVRQRVAALLPFGGLPLHAHQSPGAVVARSHMAAAGTAQRASSLADSGATAVALGRAAAAAAALFIAGGALPGLGGSVPALASHQHVVAARGAAVTAAASSLVLRPVLPPVPALRSPRPAPSSPAHQTRNAGPVTRGQGARPSAGRTVGGPGGTLSSPPSLARGGHGNGLPPARGARGAAPPPAPGAAGVSTSSSSLVSGSRAVAGAGGQLVRTAAGAVGKASGPGGSTALSGAVSEVVKPGADLAASTLERAGGVAGNIVAQTGGLAGTSVARTGTAAVSLVAQTGATVVGAVARTTSLTGTLVSRTVAAAGAATAVITRLHGGVGPARG